MSKKLKVYSGNLDGLYEAVVATTSKKRAAELLDTTLYHFNEYFTDTGNAAAIEVALAHPEVPYIKSYKTIGSSKVEDYKPMSERYATPPKVEETNAVAQEGAELLLKFSKIFPSCQRYLSKIESREQFDEVLAMVTWLDDHYDTQPSEACSTLIDLLSSNLEDYAFSGFMSATPNSTLCLKEAKKSLREDREKQLASYLEREAFEKKLKRS